MECIFCDKPEDVSHDHRVGNKVICRNCITQLRKAIDHSCGR